MVTTIHRCDLCRREYPARHLAMACEAQGLNGFGPARGGDPEVGQIVYCGSQGWWQGDPEWCSGTREDLVKNFHRAGSVTVFSRWVVVDIVPDESFGHSKRYVLWTPSNRQGQPDIRYTSPEHLPFNRICRQAAGDLLNRGLEDYRVRRTLGRLDSVS